MKSIVKKLISRLAIVAILGVVTAFSAWAQSTSTLTFTKACGGSGTANDGAVWTVTSDGTESAFDSTKGIHYGTSSAQVGYIQLSTSDITGTITSVVVNASTASGVTATASVTVGGNAFGGDPKSLSASATNYTFTGSASGSIVVRVAKPSKATKAIYVKSITVTYTPNSSNTCATPTFSPAGGTYDAAQNVTISCSTDGAAIHYTLDGTNPTASSATYSSPINIASTKTIKAIAVKDGYTNSAVASATYTIQALVSGYEVDFENPLSAYTDWTFTNAEQGTGAITAHGGTYYATTGGKSSASFQTKNKVAYPDVFTCYVSKTSNNTTASSWKIQYSANGTDWTDVATQSAIAMDRGSWVEFSGNIRATGQKNVYIRLYYDGSTAVRAVDDISLTSYTPSSIAVPVFAPVSGTTFGDEGLDVTISAAEGSIYYTVDGSVPTKSSTAYTGAIHITATTTIKAIAVVGDDASEMAVATYTYVNPNRPGTQNNPYTVSEARGAIDNAGEVTDVYATGIVSQIVTAYSAQNGNISYNISEDGKTTGAQLQAYRGKSYNGANFTSADDIKVGDEVVVRGDLTKYNSIYEFAANNQLVSLNRPVGTPTITIGATSLTGFTYEAGSGPSTAKSFTVSGENLTENIAVSVSGSDYEASLSESSGYGNTVSLTQTAGVVAETTVYVRLKAGLSAGNYNGSISLSSSGAIEKTVNLTGNVTVPVGPASLPFSFDGGRSDVSNNTGFSHTGLGPDYGSSPKLKFDGTGDELLLHFDGRPGILTYKIKGNGFTGGTFKVQASVDGAAFTDVKSYTELGDEALTETIKNLAEDVRYIKWVYTTKSGGNVALGAINLAAYAPPVPTITVEPATVNVEAAESNGSVAITCENFTVASETDFGVEFFDADSNPIADPSWIAVVVSEDGGKYIASYDVNVNFGTARTAYFKVTAPDGNSNQVYSNLVTVNQAEFAISYAVLPFAFNGGKSDVSSAVGLTYSNLGSDYGTAATTKLKFDDEGDNLILRFNEAPGTLSFDIKGNGFSEGTFKVLASVNGVDYTDVEAYTSIGDAETKTITTLASNVHFIKWEYTSKHNGNVGLGNINLTKAESPETIIINAAANAGRHWATFYGEARYTLPEGAQAFTVNSSKQLYLLGEDGRVIPASTAVVIISDSAEVTLTKSDASSAVTVNGGGNILVGSTSPTAMNTVSGTPYVLGIVGGTLGFYKFTGTGIPAGKAYYIVNE